MFIEIIVSVLGVLSATAFCSPKRERFDCTRILSSCWVAVPTTAGAVLLSECVMLNFAACNQRWRDKKYSLRSTLQVGLPRDCCILFVLFVMVLVDSPFVCGNAGPVESTGSLVGEPRVVTAVSIVREDLELDLRALSKSDIANVSATYYLENPGDPEKIKLAFAFGSERHQHCKISLDGKQIEF